MAEITTTALIALGGLLSALGTQIFLRFDQDRRDTKLRILKDLRREQTLFERIAYEARSLVLEASDIRDSLKIMEHVDKRLFSEVYRESNLVTLCAELAALGISTEGYSRDAHLFRSSCEKIVTDALGQGIHKPEDAQSAIDEIIAEVRGISGKTTEVGKLIHYRFRWRYHFKSHHGRGS